MQQTALILCVVTCLWVFHTEKNQYHVCWCIVYKQQSSKLFNYRKSLTKNPIVYNPKMINTTTTVWMYSLNLCLLHLHVLCEVQERNHIRVSACSGSLHIFPAWETNIHKVKEVSTPSTFNTTCRACFYLKHQSRSAKQPLSMCKHHSSQQLKGHH